MKFAKLSTLVIMVLVTFTACNTLKVTTDYDKTVTFTKYKTFSFYKLKVSEGVNMLNQERIINAVTKEMIKKGYVKNDSNPDLLINTTLIILNKQSVTANSYGYGGYYRPYGWGGSMGTTTYNVYDYKNGSLIIDIIDASNQKLIWQGTGNKDIDSPSNDPDAAITYAVTQIMYGYPTVKPMGK